LVEYILTVEKDIEKKALKHIIRIFARALLCIGCNLCELICPTNAISVKLNEDRNFIIEIDEKKCSGCLLCNDLCPVGTFYEIAIRE